MSSLLSVLLFGEGLMTGLVLTMMLGPVTMIILRHGIQVNRMAGVWAATGTWVSDYIFIAITFWLTTSVEAWTQRPDIKMGLYLAGGLGLLVMGLLMLRQKKKAFDENEEVKEKSYLRSFLAGFFVNSLSPFTLFFWLGAAVFLHLQNDNPFWYYAGLMLALTVGDFSKAWIAPKLTIWLKEKYVYWIQVGSGIGIAGTGLYILILGYLENF